MYLQSRPSSFENWNIALDIDRRHLALFHARRRKESLCLRYKTASANGRDWLAEMDACLSSTMKIMSWHQVNKTSLDTGYRSTREQHEWTTTTIATYRILSRGARSSNNVQGTNGEYVTSKPLSYQVRYSPQD